jgi:hypothetical protein
MLRNKAKGLVKGRELWCSHVVQSLAEILIDREKGEETIQRIIDLTEKVAQEKGHPGVITRDLFVAMLRSVAVK